MHVTNILNKKNPKKPKMGDEFRLASSNIAHDGKLPRQYTGDGQGAKRNISPPIEWYNLPEGTKSLALIVHDIDTAELGGATVPYTIWVVVNIPPTVKGLPEGFSSLKEEETAGGDYAEIKEGTNDMKKIGWHAPKMPESGHRIEFKLYALDDELHLGHKVTKDKVLDAIEGHVLGEAVLIAMS